MERTILLMPLLNPAEIMASQLAYVLEPAGIPSMAFLMLGKMERIALQKQGGSIITA